MLEKKIRRKIYKIGWQIILSICVILSLIISFKFKINSNCSLDNILNYLGIIASITGIVITGFFVILAIDIFTIYRDIKSTKEILSNETKAFKIKQNEYDILLKDYALSLYDGFEAQIGIASSSGRTTNTTLIKELQIKRARLSYKYPMLNDLIRIRLLLELGNIGEINDIIPLLKLVENENESEVIKKITFDVVNELKRKYGIKK